MSVIYEVGLPEKHRYHVHYFQHGGWYVQRQTFRTKFMAKFHARDWASLGFPAKVIDTRGD